MTYDLTAKKPAFFPSVSAEIFFEAEDSAKSATPSLETTSVDLDAELDAILKMSAST